MLIDFHTHIFSPDIQKHRERYCTRDPWFDVLYKDTRNHLASAEDLIAEMDADVDRLDDDDAARAAASVGRVDGAAVAGTARACAAADRDAPHAREVRREDRDEAAAAAAARQTPDTTEGDSRGTDRPVELDVRGLDLDDAAAVAAGARGGRVSARLVSAVFETRSRLREPIVRTAVPVAPGWCRRLP